MLEILHILFLCCQQDIVLSLFDTRWMIQSKNETLSTLFVVDLLQGVCCNIELQANSFYGII